MVMPLAVAVFIFTPMGSLSRLCRGSPLRRRLNGISKSTNETEREVMAHAGNHPKLCTRNILRRIFAALNRHKRIIRAMQHDSRESELLQLLAPVTIRNDCRHLAGNTHRIERAV